MTEPVSELSQELSMELSPDENRASMAKEYIPSKKELLTQYKIRIKFLSGRGCIVSVGCKDIAFTDYDSALKALNKYFKNPYKEGQKWEKYFSKQM